MVSRLARESEMREAAEAVVAAELDDGDGGVQGEDVGEAGDAVFGGVAGDAEVDDAVAEAEAVEVCLEEVGVGLAGVGAEAGGEGVAEADDDGAVVRRADGIGGGGGEDAVAGVSSGSG